MIAAAFADISLWQLALVAGVALFASLVGGVAGYGTGALMPLVLVPMVGPEPVVPIIAMASLLTNGGRMMAFLTHVDWRRAGLVLLASTPTCIVGAYGYTLLTSKGAMLLIGAMLVLTVPLRRILNRRRTVMGDRGLLLSSFGYGVAVGGTVGSGVMLLSILMAAGLAGPAVIATDAVVSIALGVVRIAVFGFSGAITLQTVAFAVLIGCIAFPGAFLARILVERMPVRVHTALLDAVVLVGGSAMVAGALTR